MPEESANNAAGPQSLKAEPGQPQSQLIETSLQKRQSVVIGRGIECDVVVQDAKASRRHCQLTRKDDGFILEDLGSRNGTYFNSERITGPIFLKSNQTFKIGDTVFYLSP